MTAMSKSRPMRRLTVWSAIGALLAIVTAGGVRAQEIRPIAEPNQSIKMGRGGYVCEGQLTHTAIDEADDWTYEMARCTGPIYSSNDYAALNAKLSRDELVKLNLALDRLNTTSNTTQNLLNKQLQAFNYDLQGHN
jgi:hypothetical protein